MREIKSADLDGGGSREDLENLGEGEIIIGIYFMETLLSIKRYPCTIVAQVLGEYPNQTLSKIGFELV